MLTHCVMVKMKDDAPPGQVQRIMDQLSTLPGLIPELKSYRMHTDAGISDGNFDLVVMAEFDDEAGYHAYAADAEHQRIIVEEMRPHIAARSAVQFHS